MEQLTFTASIPKKGEYDIIVAGGGVAGCAAALEAARMGKRVLLMEKGVALGGLATIGLINFFVPMCNGRGVPVIRGMAEEFLRLSIRYGYDTLPEAWKDGRGGEAAKTTRYVTRYSAPIFAMALTEILHEAGVDILFDTVVSMPVMDGKLCEGVVVMNKSGMEFYGAKMVVDATGDADVLYRAGVPTVQGNNFHTYSLIGANMRSLESAYTHQDFGKLQTNYHGGASNLYGGGHPEGKPFWKGTDGWDVTNYEVENQLEALAKLKEDDRSKRDVLQMPTMPQFRTTRRIDGDFTMNVERDAYVHFEDSVCAICDFDRNDYLYEVPLRCLVHHEYPNLITAGRIAAGEGYAWDVLRVIPPAILTGQAAGAACAMAIDQNAAVSSVDIAELQQHLERENVLIHFDDAWIPETSGEGGHAEGHI